MRKLGSGKPRSAMAPPSLHRALVFSPPDATISPASNDDSAASSSVAPDGKPHELVTGEVEKSPSCLAPVSPPPTSAITAESAEIASSSSSSSGSAPAAAKNGDPSEVSADVAGRDLKAAAVAPGFLVWACSTVASGSADDLSKKVAATVLKALEDGAAAAGEGKGDGRVDPLRCLAKVRVALLSFLLLMSSVMLIFCLSSASCGLGREPYPDLPPPT